MCILLYLPFASICSYLALTNHCLHLQNISILKSIIFWAITPCSPMSFNSCLSPTCLLVFCWTYFFNLKDGGDMFLRNVGWNSTDYTASYPRRWYSSNNCCENLKSYILPLPLFFHHLTNFQKVFLATLVWSVLITCTNHPKRIPRLPLRLSTPKDSACLELAAYGSRIMWKWLENLLST
jgi:hypothetical protein